VSSGIYTGHVSHARRGRVRHRFRYPMAMLGVDVDELPALDARLRLFSHNRANLVCLRDRDYLGAGDGRGLRAAVAAEVRRAGHAAELSRIELLTVPRVAGYAFNPVSFFLCRDAAGELSCLVAEVTNTYGGTHRYVLGDAQRVPARVGAAWRCDKALFVSPFIDEATSYEWRVESSAHPDERGARLRVRVGVFDRDGARFLSACLDVRRRPLGDAALLATLARYPLWPVWTIGLIHWRALALRRRGVPYRPPTARDHAA
jgi:uncharacterized protein